MRQQITERKITSPIPHMEWEIRDKDGRWIGTISGPYYAEIFAKNLEDEAEVQIWEQNKKRGTERLVETILHDPEEVERKRELDKINDKIASLKRERKEVKRERKELKRRKE